MSAFKKYNPGEGRKSRTPSKSHQTCIPVHLPGSPRNMSLKAPPSVPHSTGDELHRSPGGLMRSGSFLANPGSRAVLWQLAVIIGLTLPLLALGMFFFINGFFLSRDDVPYISDGREIPFPPLFPHLDPARIHLNTEQGVYYVQASQGAARSNALQQTEAPAPLELEHYLHPQLEAFASEPDACTTSECATSWISVFPYDRVLILLVDALRFDFLLWDPKASNACGTSAASECAPAPLSLRPFYRNRVPFVHDLLRRSDADLQRFLSILVRGGEARANESNGEDTSASQKDSALLAGGLPADPPVSHSSSAGLSSASASGGNHFSRLYIFEADPPTATTQRLTGIATGSMPSFFSLRETFSASAVNVDSLLMQVKAARKTSVAIGDETWYHLFGHLLTRADVFPSLNIQDLHTVDDGVAAGLPKEFVKGDWAFLVGHTLGVDHVGHVAVLDTDLMHAKLREVDSLIKDTFKMAFKEHGKGMPTKRPQTLFLTFGDHGMTEVGAHGGSSNEEVEAAMFTFSTLPAILSPRSAQFFSPDARLFGSRLPSYLQNHGAFRDNSGRLTVVSSTASHMPSLSSDLGYGALRVRQVGLAPTLSLLMGLPIPFNSMGRIIADMVPSLGSFVQECMPAARRESENSAACGAMDGEVCSEARGNDEAATVRAVRCSDLAYLAQLFHIVSWQQHRAVLTHAAYSGNDAVLTDPQFAASKSEWLRLYSELDNQIKSLPAGAHVRLTQGSVAPAATPLGLDSVLSLPPGGFGKAEEELALFISNLDKSTVDGKDGNVDEGPPTLRTSAKADTGIASILPSLLPYLLACANFSQEALQANVRQLGTFNMTLMLCGICMVLSSLLILIFGVVGIIHLPSRRPYEPSKTTISNGIPNMAILTRWLLTGTYIGVATWTAAWTLSEVCKYLQLESGAGIDVFVWQQLPALCITGILSSVAIPFGLCTLPPYLDASAFRNSQGSPQEEAEPFFIEQQRAQWGFSAALKRELCLSRLYLRLFGGGSFLFYASLILLFFVPFSDCLVDREYSVVRFLIGIYCLAACIATFATHANSAEKTKIVAACASIVFCVRVGSAFDTSSSVGRDGSESNPLQVDYVSSAAFLMLGMFYITGRRELPLVSWLFRSAPNGDVHQASGGYRRFLILSFQPQKKCEKPRPCTLERILFLTQGIILLLWFATPRESKSVQSSSSNPEPALVVQDATPLYDAVAWLWSLAMIPFRTLDAAGSACLDWLAPPKPWLFSAPHWIVNTIPPQVMEADKVKLIPLLNVALPWIVYSITAGLWLRLMLILARMKKRENDISVHHLHRAATQLSSSNDEMIDCSQIDDASELALHRRERLFLIWRVEVWDYFSHYFFLTAVTPLCMTIMLLGSVNIWPLLLCCIKWRLLIFLSRVVVAAQPCDIGHKCTCCICAVRPTAAPASAAVPHETDTKGTSRIQKRSQGGETLRFFLSDASVCMLAALLVLDGFFATGHRMKLSAIPIEAGYIGLMEYHPIWSFVTAFLHTFIVYIICCPLIFMIAFMRMAHRAAGTGIHNANELQGNTVTEVVRTTLLTSGKLAIGILIGVTLRLLSSLSSLTALRNHLFVGLGSPKYTDTCRNMGPVCRQVLV
ncbi:uncharacterized protein LOC34623068 [Cyclospora cayetanensis]|uniref:Uncharacterized protein LOC34623068 n=1 Tax=Cyclospora cayetanensis TaxID=88456 RepID=A0A6P6RU20_9EIME|nr:uncharacterized protein LOC34623068 [Cyclospora cayetanensis]